MSSFVNILFDTRWYSAIILAAGFLLDIILGDPAWFPHPVRGIGFLVAQGEPLARRIFRKREYGAGFILVCCVVAVSFFVPALLLALLRYLHYSLFIGASCLFCWLCICTRCLYSEVMKVYRRLNAGDIQGARQALAGIVGRDTARLDEKGIIRAAVETAAENLTDGVIAPVLFLTLGGPPLGMAYKAINTMDSMIGYKNSRYILFGRCAAKLDDAANWLPARLTGLLVAVAAWFLRLDARGAMRIYKRDRLKHESPNSGHGEAAFAGALGVELAGGAYYNGQFEQKPVIGEAVRDVCSEDIVRAARLMWISSILWVLITCFVSVIIRYVHNYLTDIK